MVYRLKPLWGRREPNDPKAMRVLPELPTASRVCVRRLALRAGVGAGRAKGASLGILRHHGGKPSRRRAGGAPDRTAPSRRG
eukprot:5501028-Prymnesium_polylepis.1